MEPLNKIVLAIAGALAGIVLTIIINETISNANGLHEMRKRLAVHEALHQGSGELHLGPR